MGWTLEDQMHEDIALRLDRLEMVVALQALLIANNNPVAAGLTSTDLKHYHDLLKQLAQEQRL